MATGFPASRRAARYKLAKAIKKPHIAANAECLTAAHKGLTCLWAICFIQQEQEFGYQVFIEDENFFNVVLIAQSLCIVPSMSDMNQSIDILQQKK